MRTNSRSARQRFAHRRHEYRVQNPRCEVRRYLHGNIVEEVKGGYPEWGLVEVHHIAGSGSEYHECPANYITLAKPIHDWITEGTIPQGACWYPGFVFCCYAKRLKGELDWPLLERCKGKRLPSWLDTDDFIQTCGVFPCVEKMRVELLEAV